MVKVKVTTNILYLKYQTDYINFDVNLASYYCMDKQVWRHSLKYEIIDSYRYYIYLYKIMENQDLFSCWGNSSEWLRWRFYKKIILYYYVQRTPMYIRTNYLVKWTSYLRKKPTLYILIPIGLYILWDKIGKNLDYTNGIIKRILNYYASLCTYLYQRVYNYR